MSVYIRNGREVTADEFNRTAREWPPKRRRRKAAVPMMTQAYSDSKPLVSVSMSCHPDQAAMMNAAIKEHGISGVEWDRNGKCNITSRAGRARAMPIVGNMVGLSNVHDDDGGFSDG